MFDIVIAVILVLIALALGIFVHPILFVLLVVAAVWLLVRGVGRGSRV